MTPSFAHRMLTCDWVELEHAGQHWLVAPRYLAPVGIGEALILAKKLECELPSPSLVDAIWEAADLKVAPITQAPNKGDNLEQFIAHRVAVDAQLDGKEFCLLAGTHKDVAIKDGRIGLYGWHRPDGRVIQPFFTGHAPQWKDYSQGLRLVKRC